MPDHAERVALPHRSGNTVRDRRNEVIRAAVALFAERGYKETTAADIAERAGVSRRTFFYYFHSKDDILFGVDRDALDRLTELASEQSPALSDLDAVAAVWTAFGRSGIDPVDWEETRSQVVQLRRAAESSPVLRGKEFELHLAYQGAVAEGLARRRGLLEPDDVARAAAAMGQGLMHLVVDHWVREPTSDRAELIARYFAAAKAALPPIALDTALRM